MPPTQNLRITAEGQAAANRIAENRRLRDSGMTATQARQTMRTTPPAPTVSADALTTPVTPVTVPEPARETIPAGTLNIARNVSRNAQGFIEAQTEEARRLRELQDTYGALTDQGSLSDFFTQQREQFGATPEALKELQDIQLRLANIDTGSALTETRIQGAAGQTLAQGQREVTQEQRENAVRTAGLAARAAVIQGNIETATQLARDAVNIEYQDRTLTAQNLLNQIQMVQGRVDDQTAQLLEQEKRTYEAELTKIQDVKDNIANAMVNGATQAEISELTSNRLTDDQKIALAQQITARGASEMRNLDIQQAQANIANTYSQISDRNTRLQLAQQAATLDEQTALAAGFTEQEAATEKALGMFSMLNELATHPGFGAAVGPNAFARGVSPTGAVSAFVTGDRSNFISLAEQIANTLTLDNMDKLKGPATDKDVELVANSVSKLKNRDVSQADYGAEITKISDAMKRIIVNNGATAEQLEFYGIAAPSDVSEFDTYWGATQPSGSIQVNTNF